MRVRGAELTPGGSCPLGLGRNDLKDIPMRSARPSGKADILRLDVCVAPSTGEMKANVSS